MEASTFITLEEHFLSSDLSSRGTFDHVLKHSYPPAVHRKLLAVDEDRIKNLDATDISRQILSHLALDTSVQESREINEALYAYVALYPSHLAGFAQVPMRDPVAAAAELDYAVNTLGFLGAHIPNHLSDGTFYDTTSYDVFFDKAQDLDVPVYLHPAYPSDKACELLYEGAWDKGLCLALGGWCWGWHSTVGLHVLRLYAAGVFERFPRLKVIIGHMGEMLPFMLDRIYPISAHWTGAAWRKRSLREVWDSNIWVTTSGMFSIPVMRCLMDTTRIERIMYSVDYPLASNEDGNKFLKALRASGDVTGEDFRAISYGNAAKLLKLDTVA